MNRYCCENKCFVTPSVHVDGIACRKCESFGYCMCRCKNYQAPVPKLVELKVYKTQSCFTCCKDKCLQFYWDDLQNICLECFPKPLCECKLKNCKNRSDWSAV